MNGSMVKNHISLKTGFGYPATRRTSFLLWFQACQIRLQDLIHQFKDTFRTGESLLNIFSSSSSSPTVSETKTREREDQTDSDISPVPVSTTVDERSGRPDIDQANKIQNPMKKSHRKNGETRCLGNGETRYILKSRSGCKNSVKIWWMMKFLNMETMPVLLMKCL